MNEVELSVNGQPTKINDAPEFLCVVHQQDLRVDVPGYIEINSRKTIDCMEKMNQKQWEHISTGQLFKALFDEVFHKDDQNSIPIPQTIEQLNKSDFGIIHVAGMIVLGCEALFEGNTKLFFRTPEDHLHPKTERRIVSMLRMMQNLLAPDQEIEVKVE
jgi:hypothetical protein